MAFTGHMQPKDICWERQSEYEKADEEYDRDTNTELCPVGDMIYIRIDRLKVLD